MHTGMVRIGNARMSPANVDESESHLSRLNEGETIEWSQNAEVNLRTLLCNGCIPMLLLIMMPIVLDGFIQASPASLLIVVAVYDVVAPPTLLLLLIYVIYSLVRAKRTAYYLTSQRLLEVQGRSIKREIPRVNLQGLAPSEYLKCISLQEHRASECYSIYVTDTASGVVVTMNVVGEGITDIIERWAEKQA